jgi:hypothetical protein
MKWYYRPGHPKADDLGFVNAIDLTEIPQDPPRAMDAPIMSGRFYENTKATDGTDIGSRSRYRDYLKRTGYTNSSDYPPEYMEKKKRERELSDHKERREVIAKAFWQSMEGKLDRGNNGGRGSNE